MKLLEVIQAHDNFPYYGSIRYQELLSSLWTLRLPNDNRSFGFLTDLVVADMPWTDEDFEIVATNREVRIKSVMSNDENKSYDGVITKLLDHTQLMGIFPQSLNRRKKNDEKWPILGTSLSINIDRSAISLFGICGRGAHMTAYTRTGTDRRRYKLWIPRRNRYKRSFPGMLDNTVAGGVATGETSLQCIAREMGEEAAIMVAKPRDGDALPSSISSTSLVENICAAGTVTWMNISDEKAGGQIRLVNPGILYVYDLEVVEELQFMPVDTEDIESFFLMEVQEVMEALEKGEFKPSSGMVIIDFLIRHGLITEESEEDYVDIVSRLHRRLPFPVGRAHAT